MKGKFCVWEQVAMNLHYRSVADKAETTSLGCSVRLALSCYDQTQASKKKKKKKRLKNDRLQALASASREF